MWLCRKMCARTNMIYLCWVVFAVLAIAKTIRGTTTIKSQVGSNVLWNWTFHNLTSDLIYVTHNNADILAIWPEKNISIPEPEYNDRMEVSFVRQDYEIQLIIRIKFISKNDEGLYTAKSQRNDEEIYTVDLIVADSPDKLTFVPVETTINEFGSLNITCLADCYQFCSFQWIKHGDQDISKVLVSDLATMHISNATRKDTGDYSCIATNTVTNKTVADNITLEVIYGPDNITIVPNESTIDEFDALSITCLAECYVPCSFQWIKYSNDDIKTVFISNLATLLISNATRKDAGNYSCIATNTVIKKSLVDNFSLHVIYDPDNITIVPNETTIHEFDALSINCSADCYISCSFKWIKHSDHDNTEILISVISTMLISNTTRKDAGNYSCIATNTVTNKAVVGKIYLGVIYGPSFLYFNEVKIKNDPNTEQIKTVSCFADCYPPCEYSLFGPGVDIVNSKDNFYNVTEKGTYVCRAVNPKTRKASRAIFLTISHEFEARESSTLTNILFGTAVILPCFTSAFLVYKLRKRCFKPNSNSSTTMEVVPPDYDLGTDRDCELVHRVIYSATNYWTIEEDMTGGLHTVIDKTGDLTSQSFGMRFVFQENLQEIPQPSDEDAYLHPI